MTQCEFMPGCFARALAREGVPRPPSRRLITCARRATGLASEPGKRSPLNCAAHPNGSKAIHPRRVGSTKTSRRPWPNFRGQSRFSTEKGPARTKLGSEPRRRSPNPEEASAAAHGCAGMFPIARTLVIAKDARRAAQISCALALPGHYLPEWSKGRAFFPRTRPRSSCAGTMRPQE